MGLGEATERRRGKRKTKNAKWSGGTAGFRRRLGRRNAGCAIHLLESRWLAEGIGPRCGPYTSGGGAARLRLGVEITSSKNLPFLFIPWGGARRENARLADVFKGDH